VFGATLFTKVKTSPLVICYSFNIRRASLGKGGVIEEVVLYRRNSKQVRRWLVTLRASFGTARCPAFIDSSELAC
jgi:hypothetical protein